MSDTKENILHTALRLFARDFRRMLTLEQYRDDEWRSCTGHAYPPAPSSI